MKHKHKWARAKKCKFCTKHNLTGLEPRRLHCEKCGEYKYKERNK